jgi:hypothetical protein
MFVLPTTTVPLQGSWLPRQALHASRLCITHPLTQSRLTFHAPLPDDMVVAAASLGLTASPSLQDPADLQQARTELDTLLLQAWEQLH